MHWWHRGQPDKGVRTGISDDLLCCPGPSASTWRRRGRAAALRARAGPVRPAAGGRGGLALRPPPPRLRKERGRPRPRRSLRAAARLGQARPAAHGRRGLVRRLRRRGRGGPGRERLADRIFAHTARRSAALLERLGDTPGAAALSSSALPRALRAVEAAWDGGWYRRGYFDSGAPLGSRESRGCKSIPSRRAGPPSRPAARSASGPRSKARFRPLPTGTAASRALCPALRRTRSTPDTSTATARAFAKTAASIPDAAVWLAFGLPAQRPARERAGAAGRAACAGAGITAPSRSSSPPTSIPPRAAQARRAGAGIPAARAGSSDTALFDLARAASTPAAWFCRRRGPVRDRGGQKFTKIFTGEAQ